jgi:hypothetical protein
MLQKACLLTTTVTGGAGTLALASARALLEHGLSGLALLDLPAALGKSKPAIDALCADFPKIPIVTEACDVTNEKEVHDAVGRAKDQLGGLDILCCFAGMVKTVAAEDLTIAEWRKVLDVNTTGSWIAAQAVGKCGFPRFPSFLSLLLCFWAPMYGLPMATLSANRQEQTSDSQWPWRSDRLHFVHQRPSGQLSPASSGL